MHAHRIGRHCLLAVSICLSCAAFAPGEAATPFYQGKQLTILVNLGAGGGPDIEGRLLAKHLPRHLDGNPTILVQNMDGAGGLTGARYVGEVAPRDGTILGLLTGVAWRFALDPSRFKVSLADYEFIAYQPSTAVYYARTDINPGLRSVVDIGKAEGIVSGGLSPDTSRDLLIRLGLEMLGVRHKHITGYKNSAAARLAMQQGEINFYAETAPAYRSTVDPGIVREGLAIPIWHDPDTVNGELVPSAQITGLAIAPFHEVYRRVKGAPPSGELWEAYKAIIALNGSMIRLMAFPPDVPATAVDAMRAAIQRVNADVVFAEEGTRAVGYALRYETGPDTNSRVRNGMTISEDLRRLIMTYIAKAGR